MSKRLLTSVLGFLVLAALGLFAVGVGSAFAHNNQ